MAMLVDQEFGGPWTEDKLERIERYLRAYLDVMKKQPFHLSYVDAFAGTGSRTERASIDGDPELIDEDAIYDFSVSRRFLGSAQRALAIEKGRSFDQYVFIESRADYFAQLEKLREAYPGHSSKMRFIHGDANDTLRKFCEQIEKAPMSRAVVFLDPYGLSVDWSTIHAIAGTGKVDMWYLFPVMGLNRVLKRNGKIPSAWCDRLDRLFGRKDWNEEFFQPRKQPDLFGRADDVEKRSGIEPIQTYILTRLREEFQGVAENPLLLKNSAHSPLFLLFFAAGNPKGAKPAVNIAQHILRMS